MIVCGGRSSGWRSLCKANLVTILEPYKFVWTLSSVPCSKRSLVLYAKEGWLYSIATSVNEIVKTSWNRNKFGKNVGIRKRHPKDRTLENNHRYWQIFILRMECEAKFVCSLTIYILAIYAVGRWGSWKKGN